MSKQAHEGAADRLGVTNFWRFSVNLQDGRFDVEEIGRIDGQVTTRVLSAGRTLASACAITVRTSSRKGAVAISL